MQFTNVLWSIYVRSDQLVVATTTVTEKIYGLLTTSNTIFI